MKVRFIQWFGYLMVSFALASAGLTFTDWRWWVGIVGILVAVLANYHEGRTYGVKASALAQPSPPADNSYPEGFDASCGLSAHAMRTANGIMASVIGKREWDVPMVAAALESFRALGVCVSPEPSGKEKQ